MCFESAKPVAQSDESQNPLCTENTGTLCQARARELNHRRVLHKTPRGSKKKRTHEENPYLTQAKTGAENQYHTRICRFGR